jgi:hypothetical protein
MPGLYRGDTPPLWRVASLLCLALQWSCGDEPTAPSLTRPGYALDVAIPGLTDTIFRGESASWRFLSDPNPAGDPELRDMTLEMLILDPPPPLLSPLEFEIRWYRVPTAFPTPGTFALGLDPPGDVVFEANTNLGTWASSEGHVILTDVNDSTVRGTIAATLVPVHPPGTALPDVTVRGSFWARHVADLPIGN